MSSASASGRKFACAKSCGPGRMLPSSSRQPVPSSAAPNGNRRGRPSRAGSAATMRPSSSRTRPPPVRRLAFLSADPRRAISRTCGQCIAASRACTASVPSSSYQRLNGALSLTANVRRRPCAKLSAAGSPDGHSPLAGGATSSRARASRPSAESRSAISSTIGSFTTLPAEYQRRGCSPQSKRSPRAGRRHRSGTRNCGSRATSASADGIRANTASHQPRAVPAPLARRGDASSAALPSRNARRRIAHTAL